MITLLLPHILPIIFYANFPKWSDVWILMWFELVKRELFTHIQKIVELRKICIFVVCSNCVRIELDHPEGVANGASRHEATQREWNSFLLVRKIISYFIMISDFRVLLWQSRENGKTFELMQLIFRIRMGKSLKHTHKMEWVRISGRILWFFTSSTGYTEKFQECVIWNDIFPSVSSQTQASEGNKGAFQCGSAKTEMAKNEKSEKLSLEKFFRFELLTNIFQWSFHPLSRYRNRLFYSLKLLSESYQRDTRLLNFHNRFSAVSCKKKVFKVLRCRLFDSGAMAQVLHREFGKRLEWGRRKTRNYHSMHMKEKLRENMGPKLFLLFIEQASH